MFFLLARRDAGERASVKRAGHSDDAISLGPAIGIMEPPHHFNPHLHRFAAGVVEKYRVGKGVGDKPFGQALLAWDMIQV